MKQTNKETIEVVKQMLADGVLSQEQAEKYVPELKKNNDERIRKEIVETLKYANEVGGILNDVKCREYIAWLEQGEQKPAWSEEDENKKNDAITAIDLIMTDSYKEIHPNLYKAFGEAKDWLKSLKDRVQPQTEWDEHDEESLKDVLANCSNSIKLTEWVKSLKYRAYWKPSIEAISAVRTAMGEFPVRGLSDLYFDLLKLQS